MARRCGGSGAVLRQGPFLLLFLLLLLAPHHLHHHHRCLVGAILRSADELTSHCYHVPSKDFGKDNNVKTTYGASPHVMLQEGDLAIDFTLPKIDGTLVTLSDLLKDKAVVLVWGHYTCPAFQGFNSDSMFLGSSWEEEQDLIDTVGKHITVVHLIGPEPHPIWPYVNFDSGNIKMNYWSTITQPQSFSERLSVSASRVLPYLHKEAVFLIDYLDGPTGQYNNPVWCSYANAARAAILIGQDGVVIEAQTWFSKDTMAAAVQANV